MDEETKKQIRAKIAELTKQRDDFIRRAGEEVAGYGGAIRALEDLLNEQDAKIESQIH